MGVGVFLPIKNTSVYWARIWHNRRCYRISTHERDRDKAFTVALKLYTDIQNGDFSVIREGPKKDIRDDRCHGAIIDYLKDHYDNICQLCSSNVEEQCPIHTNTKVRPSADHIIPISQGGLDKLDNLQLTHWCCNIAKGDGVKRGKGTTARAFLQDTLNYLRA